MSILTNFAELFSSNRVIPSCKRGTKYIELYQNIFDYFTKIRQVCTRSSKLTNIDNVQGRNDITNRDSDLDELGLLLFIQRGFKSDSNQSRYDISQYDVDAFSDDSEQQLLWSDDDYRFLIKMNCIFSNFRCTIDDYLYFFSTYFSTNDIILDISDPFVINLTVNANVPVLLRSFILSYIKLPLGVKLNITYN